jgi:hypothetical protein
MLARRLAPLAGEANHPEDTFQFPTYDEAEALGCFYWTDQFVRTSTGPPAVRAVRGEGGDGGLTLQREAIVDFADGAWYDIPATDVYLEWCPTRAWASTTRLPTR